MLGDAYAMLTRCLRDAYAIVDALPDEHRIVLTLAYVDAMTDTEIAAHLGVITRTVYRRKAAALTAAKKAANVMFHLLSGTDY